jgi:hypothetical protein
LSYDEVVRFKNSVVASSSPDIASDAIIAAKYTRWIAGNVDHNDRTLDGYGAFHGMGIIAASVYNRTRTFTHTYPVVKLKK